MNVFIIGQRVRLNPLHHLKHKTNNLAGRHGRIVSEKTRKVFYIIDVDMYGDVFINEESLIIVSEKKPEFSDWTTIEASTGFNPAKGNV